MILVSDSEISVSIYLTGFAVEGVVASLHEDREELHCFWFCCSEAVCRKKHYDQAHGKRKREEAEHAS